MVLPEHVNIFATRAQPIFKSSISSHFEHICGPGSVVGIATGYWLGDPGIECRWGEIFRICPDRYWNPSGLLYNGYRVFPGSKELPGRDADPSHLLMPWPRKNRAIPLLPYGPYGLYRASVPVQGYTLPLPIPPLSLWTIRPVQSLSACTTVQFTFTL
jgi:hypothetical protein